MRWALSPILLTLTAMGAAAQPIIVAPEDLAAGSARFSGKFVTIPKLNCYFSGPADYRCVSTNYVSIFAKDVQPQNEKRKIETKCDKMRLAISSPACRLNIRFLFNENMKSSDIVSGYQKRILIRPDLISITTIKRHRR